MRRVRYTVFIAIAAYGAGVYSAKSLLKWAAIANLTDAYDRASVDLNEEEQEMMMKVAKLMTQALKKS